MLIDHYLNTRKMLKRVCVLIDARHGLKVNDKEFITNLDAKNVKFQIVLTKADLMLRKLLLRVYQVTVEDLTAYRNVIMPPCVVSARTGAGIDHLRRNLLHAVGKSAIVANQRQVKKSRFK